MGADDAPSPSAPPMPGGELQPPPASASYPVPAPMPAGQYPPPPPPAGAYPPPQPMPPQGAVNAYCVTEGRPAAGVPVGNQPYVHQGTRPNPGFPEQQLRRLPRCGGCHNYNGFNGQRAGASFRCWGCGGVTTLPHDWQERPRSECILL
eukprot:TRINITY_DN35576_c0_g1_i1.p1 TRINITY_DN35576_c0_g1~~TRINITY_DN35576_c0_g1_i1.p1  ORF type:complete len:168 (+),score=9.44 TRINITY_DN35576_c0_g1_i1:58-504(+)